MIRLGILLSMVLVGCTAPQDSTSGASRRAAILGVVLDEHQRVVDVWAGGAAEKIGLSVGDVLLDLTWIPSANLIAFGTPVIVEESGAPTEDVIAATPQAGVVVTEIVGIPAPTVPPEQYLDSTPVPFTDSERISSLTGYGLPLRIRFERAGEVLEMEIVPNTTIFRMVAPGEGTPTPIPSGLYYY